MISLSRRGELEMSQRSMGSKVWAILSPVLVVIALGALSTVRLEVPRIVIDTPVIETRDRFMGLAVVDDVIWVVGKDGKIVRSEDAGKSWVSQSTGLNTNFQSIAAWDEQTAVVVANAGKGLITSDGGQTWEEVSLPVSDIGSGKVLRVRLDPQGRAWAVAELNVIMRSDDRGRTWQRVTQDDNDAAWNDIAFSGPGSACAVGEFGRVACTVDDGATWEERPVDLEPSLMSVRFRDAEHGLAVGLSGTVLATDDAGANWRVVEVPELDQHLFDVIWTGTRWIAVGDKGVMLTGDAGATHWETGRVQSGDFSWHIALARQGAGFVTVGLNVGRWEAGQWELFGPRRH
ncbi:MAG TPA: glycosyl hydrolase [Gammaproteobacteria bacterium]|nr:glycosyl hydrolase [Gammaproteobacteria bacterium]